MRGDSAGAATEAEADVADARRFRVARAMRDETSNEMASREAYVEWVGSRARSASIRVRERWNTRRGSSAWRYWMEEETVVSALTTDLEGANVDPERGDLSLMMCAHDALEAPIGEFGDGEATARARVFAVDVFLTVDGVSYEDAHACGGEPECDRARSIEFGLDEAGFTTTRERDAARKLLGTEPRACHSKPWCTLFGSQFSNGNHFVHLPLMAESSYSIDGAILDPYSKSYGHALMCRWAEACEKMGPGTHVVTFRCAPLGVVVAGSEMEMIHGDVGESDEFKQFLVEIEGEYETAEDAPGMTVTFSLSLRPEHCTGRKPERRAQEWAPDWPSDEIEECYVTAMELANTGAQGAMAEKMVPGSKCCHVILPSTDGQSGIAAVKNDEGVIIAHEFHAWGLYRSVLDENVAQIKFRCVREMMLEGDEFVPTGPWLAKDYDPRPCNGLVIKNKAIDEAIARDDAKVKIPGGVEA